jgi:hypothetical protein
MRMLNMYSDSTIPTSRFTATSELLALPQDNTIASGEASLHRYEQCRKARGIGSSRIKSVVEMLRIILEARPSFVVVENPEGLLVRGGREVVASLRMAGYCVEDPLLVSAKEIGSWTPEKPSLYHCFPSGLCTAATRVPIQILRG